MKQLFTSLSIIALSLTAGAQTQSYFFVNNFNGTGGGPTLTEVLNCSAAPGGFDTATINTVNGVCTGGPQTVFEFNQGDGFSHANGFITGTYTIDIFFEFNELMGYNRIIDFKNSATDQGLYTLSDCLNFYPNGNSGTCPFFQDSTFYLITLVRDDTTDFVDVYVNGSLFVSDYNDASGIYAAASTSTPILLFRDDNQIGCEHGDGSIRYFSLKAGTSTPAEVAATYFNICGIIAAPFPLAGGITGFNANRIGSGHLLSWSAAGEEGTSRYEVGRSRDGETWETIGTQTATGQGQYSLTDAQPRAGKNYYRLRSHHRDGTASFSRTVTLSFAMPDMRWTLASNPTSGAITLLQKGGGETARVALYNMQGQRLWQGIANAGRCSIPADGLPNGIYTVTCGSAQFQQALRVTVQH